MIPTFGTKITRALQEVAEERDPLRAAALLRKHLPPDLAALAAELSEGRRRAAGTWPAAERMFLTRKGLEQSTRPPVGAFRASELARLARSASVLDATAGIGGDSLALAAAGFFAVSADRDPLALACAAANLSVLGHVPRVILAAAEAPAARTDLLLLDPDRRPKRGARDERGLDPALWSPDFETSLRLAGRCAGACLKLAPGLDPARIGRPPLAARLRWVSHAGELTELGLWTGVLAGETAAGELAREAVVLGRDGTVTSLEGEPEDAPPLTAAELDRAAFLAEPDPAVIRSGLLGRLARLMDLAPVAPEIAYLAGARPGLPPLVRSFRILGHTSADAKRVRALLGEHDVGPVTVKKRGHPDSAEVLARRFRGPGTRPGTVIVARLASGHRAWLVEALD